MDLHEQRRNGTKGKRNVEQSRKHGGIAKKSKEYLRNSELLNHSDLAISLKNSFRKWWGKLLKEEKLILNEDINESAWHEKYRETATSDMSIAVLNHENPLHTPKFSRTISGHSTITSQTMGMK